MWSSNEHPVDMAFSALDVDVRAGQFKCGQVMIESGICPIGRIVALLTGSPKFPIMLVILLVAGVTVLGSALETTAVAALARHIHMFSLELEIRQVVVKRSRLPACWCVALTALGTIFTCTGIIG